MKRGDFFRALLPSPIIALSYVKDEAGITTPPPAVTVEPGGQLLISNCVFHADGTAPALRVR